MFSPSFCTSAWRTDSTVPPSSGSAPSAATSAGLRSMMTCATLRANAMKSSLRDTKSVSQLTSTIAPVLPSGVTVAPTTPSAATRPAALDALAPLLIRSSSSALTMSPSLSDSAFLHSIMPSPVRWRSSITVLAEMSAILRPRLSLFTGTLRCPDGAAPRSAGPRIAGQKQGGRFHLGPLAGWCRRYAEASSCTSTNSSPVATISWMTVLLPSSTASATPRAYRRIARLESSLPGIT